MAITTTNARYEGFIFDGENSRDYGVYVTDVEVFGAPVRNVEMVTIPGRNGAFALDKGSYENIEVTYKCVMGCKTPADFNAGISAFRNMLASRTGYKRLEDEINTSEYRMACFRGGISVPTLNKETATFDVVFDCKPQRFLKSGEIPRTIGGAVTNPQTKSGAVVSIDSDGGDKATSLIATIEAVQAGSGDPSPTNVRAITGHTSANVTVAGKNLIGFGERLAAWGSNYTDIGNDSYLIKSAGTGYREPYRFADEDIDVTLSGIVTDLEGSRNWRINLLNANNVEVGSIRQGETVVSGKASKIRLNYGAGGNGAIYEKIQLELGTQATPYESYKGTTATTALGRTVYGGTLDIVTGTLTVTHKAETFDGTEPWGSEQSGGLTNYYLNLDNAGKMAGRQGGLLDDELLCNWLAPSPSITTYGVYVGATSKYLNCKCSSASDVAAFKSMLTATPLVVVYPLATPQTYNLTTHEVELLAGQNNVWADTGDISITYGHDPNKLVNPTLFESSPLLMEVGEGKITINDNKPLGIYHKDIGRIMLANRTNSNSVSFSVGALNVGDEVKLDSSTIEICFGVSSDIINDMHTAVPSGSPITVTADPGGDRGTVTAKWNPWAVQLPSAQSDSTQSVTAAITVEYWNGSGFSEVTFDIVFDIVYSYNSFELRYTTTVPSIFNEGVFSEKYTTGEVTAYSTKSANTETLYFDLDIGEAYVYVDGELVSVNNAVTIPAKLPVLVPGTNTITYDNTITQFQIVPRWWQL